MKKNLWMIVGLVMSTSLLADDQLQSPAAGAPPDAAAPAAVEPAPAEMAPAAAEPAPAPAPKKKTVKRQAVPEKPVALVAGPATVAVNGLNVRGQARLNSEAVGRLHDGDTVTVIEQVRSQRAKPGTPRQWAKIAIPSGINVWVFSSYIDSANMTVKARKLNLRAGPGENYSILGTVETGTPVKQIQTKGNWMEIEAPAGAYAFVAATFLHQEPAPAEMASVPMEALPAEAAPLEMVVPDINAEMIEAEPVAFESSAPPEPVVVARVVSHEGVVRPTVNPNSPTPFQLVSPETDKVINFLYTTSDSVEFDLRGYNGRHVIVTGEEAMDKRWKTVPVLTIQSLHVVE